MMMCRIITSPQTWSVGWGLELPPRVARKINVSNSCVLTGGLNSAKWLWKFVAILYWEPNRTPLQKKFVRPQWDRIIQYLIHELNTEFLLIYYLCIPPYIFLSKYMYNVIHMAKRITGLDKKRTSRSKKTKKRLAIKHEMLAKKAAKKCK